MAGLQSLNGSSRSHELDAEQGGQLSRNGHSAHVGRVQRFCDRLERFAGGAELLRHVQREVAFECGGRFRVRVRVITRVITRRPPGGPNPLALRARTFARLPAQNRESLCRSSTRLPTTRSTYARRTSENKQKSRKSPADEKARHRPVALSRLASVCHAF